MEYFTGRCKPDAETFNALINVHGRAGQWRWAMNIKDDMLRAAVCICTLLPYREEVGWCLGGEMVEVLAVPVKGRWRACGGGSGDVVIPPSRSTYNNLINACESSGNWRQVLQVCQMMTENGVGPDQGRFTEAESTFTTMKVAGDWEKAAALLEEMGMNNVQPDAIAFSARLRAFNTGCQPAKVMSLAGVMREKNIPFSDAIFLEMLSACSILRDWSMTTKLIKMMEPSFPVISVGVLNQLLLFIGKSGKIETMMMIFLKIVATGGEISVSTYSIVLRIFWLLEIGGNISRYWDGRRMQEFNRHLKCIAGYCTLHKMGVGFRYAAVIQERVRKLSFCKF
ncbi:hypothetical protein RHGRI_019540 [Rhododendron griersonianum]|uniref:Pentatricopeptide repeat-containing protein n=1 Tax=Rhododendron griersonianum TaxID=479676 RepID=A0AAV6JCT1_9ERIC|nr:hypothetical protein RHGRI_019540 [Rhododendron griersonianum]